jgi:hypothetical protein
MKVAAEGARLFIAFFLLFSMIYWGWWAEHRTKDIPITDREGFLVAALTAVGLTILWMDWRKT